MPKVQKRKYEKIDDEEIDLVVKCKDSHEFYERYREVFPNRKKGIESIGKIWKRRNEFLKKRQDPSTAPDLSTSSSHELDALIATQNKMLAELSQVMEEHLKVSRGIMTLLQKQNQVYDNYVKKHRDIVDADNMENKEHVKEPVKKQAVEKPADIMIGS